MSGWLIDRPKARRTQPSMGMLRDVYPNPGKEDILKTQMKAGLDVTMTATKKVMEG